MKSISVLILMGSDSDAPVMQGAADVLNQFQIPWEMTVASAHRSPERAGALCRSVLAICAELGVTVIAEGIETEDDRRLVESHRCDGMQGYLFSKPMAPREVGPWLTKFRYPAAVA